MAKGRCMLCPERFRVDDMNPVQLNKLIKKHYQAAHPKEYENHSIAVMWDGKRRGRGVAVPGRKYG